MMKVSKKQLERIKKVAIIMDRVIKSAINIFISQSPVNNNKLYYNYSNQ